MDKISIHKETRKRLNAFAQFTDDEGTRYATVPKHILEWVDPPVPPADYSDETYYRTEQDESPYVIYTKKSDEQLEQIRQSKVNMASQQYLDDTDWMVTRAFEDPTKPVPDDVKAKRQSARDAIVKLPAP